MREVERRRSAPRMRKRIKVKLGAALLFTADVSSGGFCAEVMRVPAPGSLVQGVITLGAREFPFKGEVAWVKVGDARLNVRGRFGVRFIEVSPDFLTHLDKPTADPAPRGPSSTSS